MSGPPFVRLRDHCGVVAVDGPDALSYLQSLVSQDLDPLADGEGTRSLLLQPQGKLTAVFRALRLGPESMLLDTDEDFGAVLAEGLNRFKIRVKVDITDRSDAWGVGSVRGDAAVAVVENALGVVVPAAQHAHVATDDLRVVRADWPDREGVDLVGPLDALRAAGDALIAAGATAVDDDEYERARIEAGVPRQGVDVDDKTIPQEAFLELEAVSFTKGCFLGQELVCRIDSRGHVNRALRRVTFAHAGPTRGDAVSSGDKEVGTITSIEPTGDGAVALAMLRREIEPGAEVIAGDQTGLVSAL
jgi:tRNA-modifying protein YgfZ